MAEAALAPEMEEGQEEAASSEKLAFYVQASNIADHLDGETLTSIGMTVCEEFAIDEQSRKDEGWDDVNDRAMKAALQAAEVKNYPWPKASNVKFPLLTTAAIQFNARAYPAIVDGGKPVKGKVLGQPSEQKAARAERVASHMSYQLMEEMPGWEASTDRLLLMLPILGDVFRKSWFDPVMKVNRSELVLPKDLVVNYWAQSLDACPRVTQCLKYYPHEVTERIRSGVWLDVELHMGVDEDKHAPHDFLEQHRLLDLDGDNYPEPYIVTVHKETQRVVRIVARFDPEGVKLNGKGEVERIDPVRYFTQYAFIPSPDGSFYNVGFGRLLGSIGDSIDTTINQLMDAGHLANMQGGFIGAGSGIKTGSLRFTPGEWKKLPSDAGNLSQNIVPLPTREPSAVLFNLLGMLVEASRDITATKDILTGETQGNNQAVGTTLAMIEQGLKVFTAIYKRIHRALKDELACLYRLNRLFLDPQKYFTFQDIEGVIAQADYAAGDCDVVPVSDPNVVTDMQRMARAQFLMQFMGAPGMNGHAIVERVLEAAMIPDAKELFAPPQPDPALEVKKVELQQKEAELDAREHEIAVKTAEAQAKATETYARALQILSSIGAQPASTDPETGVETPATQASVPPQAIAMLSEIDGIVEQKIGENNAEIQSGDVRGMEGASVDGAVPPVPQGLPDDAGEGMGGGGADGPQGPDESLPDGGIVEPGMA